MSDKISSLHNTLAVSTEKLKQEYKTVEFSHPSFGSIECVAVADIPLKSFAGMASVAMSTIAKGTGVSVRLLKGRITKDELERG